MIPAHIGPWEFGRLGKLIAVRCPHEFDQVMRTAGGHRRVGDLADALFREIVRRATRERDR